MTIQNVYANDKTATTAPAKFELPNGVTEDEKTGKLVDNRPFYQLGIFGHDSLTSLQDKHNADKKAKADKETSWFDWFMTPVYTVGGWIVSLFTCCGLFSGEGKADKANAGDNKDTKVEKKDK